MFSAEWSVDAASDADDPGRGDAESVTIRGPTRSFEGVAVAPQGGAGARRRVAPPPRGGRGRVGPAAPGYVSFAPRGRRGRAPPPEGGGRTRAASPRPHPRSY